MIKTLTTLSVGLIIALALICGYVNPEDATLWQYILVFFSIAALCGVLSALFLRLMGFVKDNKTVVAVVLCVSCIVMLLLIVSWARALSLLGLVLFILLAAVLLWYLRRRARKP